MEFIRKVNIFVAGTLIVNNAVSVFLSGTGTDFYINLFISVLIIAFNLIKGKYSISVMYVLVGVVVAFTGSNDNFAAIFLIVIGCYIAKNGVFNAISFLILILTSLLRYSIMEWPISSFANHMVAYSYLALIAYELFWPTSEIKAKEVKSHGLTPEQVETIELLKRGLKHQAAADLLHIERNTFSARVAGLRKRFGVETDFQLAIELMKEDILSLNKIAIAKTEE